MRSSRYKWTTFTLLGVFLVVLPVILGVPGISLIAASLLVLYMPGAQITKWLGLFRSWDDLQTLFLSLAVGMVVTPPILYWAGLVAGFQKWTILMVLSGFVLVMSLVNDYQGAATPAPFPPLVESKKRGILLVAGVAISAFLVWLPHLDLVTDSGVYPVSMSDWRKQYAVVWSLEHTGVPPRNVLVAGMGSSLPLVYYYFFHLLAAAVDMLVHAQPHIHAVLVGIILVEIIVFEVVVYIFVKRYFRSERVALYAVGLLAFVGGLDILPMVFQMWIRWTRFSPPEGWTLLSLMPSSHIESWASPLGLRINIFYVLFIWVPQHIGGVLVCLIGLYLYFTSPHPKRFIVLLPVLLFSLVGYSFFVALVGFLGIGLFGVGVLLARGRIGEWKLNARTIIVGIAVPVVFLLLSLPLSIQIFDRTIATPSGIVLEIPTPGILFGIPNNERALLIAPFQMLWGDYQWTRLLDLPLHVFVELGVFGVAGLLGLKGFLRDRSYPRITWLLLSWLIVAFLMAFFFVSGRGQASINYIGFNNLSFRAPMLGQLVLVIFSAYYLSTRRWWQGKWLTKVGHSLLVVMVLLGVLATGWEVVGMGLLKYLESPELDRENYEALMSLPQATEPLSIVQHRPVSRTYLNQLEYGDRLVALTEVAYDFYPSAATVGSAFELIDKAFSRDLAAESYQKLQVLNVDYVYLDHRAMKPSKFPSKFNNLHFFQPVYNSDQVRVYRLLPWPEEKPLASFLPHQIDFMGYVVDASIAEKVAIDDISASGQPYLVTGWQLSSPVSEDYTVYVHFLADDGGLVAQADHLLVSQTLAGLVPTSQWQPGQIYLDIVPLPPELQTVDVPLNIGIGLWLPQAEAHLLPESDQLSIDPATRLIIGTYPIPDGSH